jgi:hypothetical protein
LALAFVAGYRSDLFFLAIRFAGRVGPLAKATNSACVMGFATSSDMRPIWSFYPSHER